MHCVDLGESFQTHIFLQNFASIQPRTSPPEMLRRDGLVARRDRNPSRAASIRIRPWHPAVQLDRRSRRTMGAPPRAKLASYPMSKLAKFCKFLAGSFSALSKRNSARKYAFDSIFQALQDLHTFAPLQSQNFRKKSV